MPEDKPFDTIRFTRETRARVGRQLAEMPPEEQARWINDHAARGDALPPGDPRTGSPERLKSGGFGDER